MMRSYNQTAFPWSAVCDPHSSVRIDTVETAPPGLRPVVRLRGRLDVGPRRRALWLKAWQERLQSRPVNSPNLLAKFVAFLQTDVAQEEIEKVELPHRPIRISSPRLARPEQAGDFKKEVVWETAE